MKKIWKTIFLIVLMMFIATQTCMAASTSGNITMLDDFKYVQTGARFRISANNTSMNKVVWSSSNTSVAKVDESGYVTCVGNGAVTVTADIGHAKADITFNVGDYSDVFRTGYKEVNLNAGACAYIELKGKKADFYSAGAEGNAVEINNGAVYFYDNSIRVNALETGTSYVTVFNSSGYGCTMKVNVIGSKDTANTTGLVYKEKKSRELFQEINQYRKSLGLNTCLYSELASDSATAQIITAHRMAGDNPDYDYTLHNSSQLSCFYSYGNITAADMLAEWKASSGHNKALTNADYRIMGVSVYETPYGTCAFMFIGTETMLANIITGDANPGPLPPASETEETIIAKNITKTFGSMQFTIGAKASVPLTYRSSNTSVAKVAKRTGLVTITGCGKTSIRISGKNLKTKTITLTVNPRKQSVKLRKTGKKSFKISVRKDNNVTGYQITYSKTSDFKNKKTITTKGYKKYTKTLKGLTGRRYYVKVRSFKKGILDGKRYTVYGSYSKVKLVKLR